MSNILMCGTDPVGQVCDITADNVEYSSGVSVKDKLDTITNELDLMDISSDCVGVEFGVFPVSFSYGGTTHNVNVFGVKMKQNNSRNVILGMIQGGSDLPYRFIANTSWNNKTCLVNPTD